MRTEYYSTLKIAMNVLLLFQRRPTFKFLKLYNKYATRSLHLRGLTYKAFPIKIASDEGSESIHEVRNELCETRYKIYASFIFKPLTLSVPQDFLY